MNNKTDVKEIVEAIIEVIIKEFPKEASMRDRYSDAIDSLSKRKRIKNDRILACLNSIGNGFIKPLDIQSVLLRKSLSFLVLSFLFLYVITLAWSKSCKH